MLEGHHDYRRLLGKVVRVSDSALLCNYQADEDGNRRFWIKRNDNEDFYTELADVWDRVWPTRGKGCSVEVNEEGQPTGKRQVMGDERWFLEHRTEQVTFERVGDVLPGQGKRVKQPKPK